MEVVHKVRKSTEHVVQYVWKYTFVTGFLIGFWRTDMLSHSALWVLGRIKGCYMSLDNLGFF